MNGIVNQHAAGPAGRGLLQVCLNGARTAGESAAVPMTPEAMARSAARAVAAGAAEVHVHPKTPCGQDSVSGRLVAETVEAIRAAAVGVPVGVTTGAWAEPDPVRRVERVRSWTVLPDLASVNWHEPGAEEVAAALLERGVAVEAGLWSGTPGARLFAASPLAPRVARVLAEVTDTDPATAPRTARALLEEAAPPAGVPVLLHGEDGGAWPVLRLALDLGLDTRIGLEDTLLLPDGTPAASNAELVTAAAHLRAEAEHPPAE
ncbi:3-keto-5-aminohexanoate cleavage protein [Streptomyces lichenis]|uniref:3-keto-5-aminohexanoate cleavage protein n=1 Tax=Streptomyces lichenis TaxID=2306967 RepID=A0ABT0IDA4_9ACTN|nr:3-keto-5-aminohexanoate cleavage protein [Streptomyces lichenis]MCK8679304.1 3-keto-5-aminohexanoate cleavage protein [Streptomyces lichenis]